MGFIILFLIAISLPNFLEAQIRVSAPIETPSLVGEPTRFTLQGVIGETVAIRERFPETLLWLPEVVLDASGQAEVGIPPADSITQWNIEVRTHEGEGRFGRASEMFAIHKDLVVEPDLPIFMYEGDEIEIPVRVSNHSSESLSVSLEAEVEGGLEPIDPGWERRMEVSPGEIGVTSFRVSAARPESATITLVGRSDLIFDAVKRALRILPFSESREKVITRRVKGVWQEEIPLPEDAIPGTIHGEVALALTSTALIEKSLPTLEHLLRKPYGCFEQTSSVAYPNALVLRLADELGFGDRGFHERAKQLVLESYQRLLTFEVSCGGFSLFGKKPASPPLSALGLSEFSEMDGLISVDRAITERTAGYLSQTLKPSVLSETDLAYTSAAVAAVKSGEYIPSWLREHVRNVIPLETDPYRLGLWIEALGALSSEEPLLNSGRERLISMVSSDGDLRWWSASDRTVMGSRGSYADIEATAVAIQALAHTGPGIELLSGAEEWLIAKMSSDGSWGTTQATVQALRALIALSRLNRGADSCKVKVMQGDSLTEVYLDSHHPQTTFPLAIQDETGCFLSIQQDDQAPLITRILISYRVRWDKSAHNREGPMEMTFISPTIEACRGQTIQTTLELAWNGTEKGETPLVSVPLPAGFRFSSTGKADLECIKEVQKVQATGEAVHIYLADMEPGARVSLPVDLTVDFAGTFNTPPIEAHLYYQPNMRVRAVHDCWVTFDTRNQ